MTPHDRRALACAAALVAWLDDHLEELAAVCVPLWLPVRRQVKNALDERVRQGRQPPEPS